jgi:glutamate/tyrosine decarboxylase-like PLP-dependent enzyme
MTGTGDAGEGPLTLPVEEARRLGYAAVDAVVGRLAGLGSAPLGTVTPEGLDRRLAELAARRVPDEPTDPVDVLAEVLDQVLPAIVAQDHVRYVATIPSPANVVAVVADLLASGFNVFAGNWAEGAGPAAVERATVRWLAELVGMPAGTGGLFVSGGSMANLTALVAARHFADDGGDRERERMYVTTETHSCLDRAARVLGLRTHQIRRVPVDADHRMDPGALAGLLDADRAAGLRPFAVVATVGTTSTGAVDPLPALAEVARPRGVWLHADGAFGAAAVLDPRGRAAVPGIDRLDSLALDPHKWWFQPYETGALLARDPGALRAVFRQVPDYLAALDRDEPGQVTYYDLGFQVTRSFRALKVWMSMQTFGVDAFRTAVARGLDRAQWYAERLRDRPGWAVVTGPQLAVVTFRYVGDGGLGEAAEDLVAAEVSRLLWAEYGIALTTTRVDGRTVLRVCTINPRATEADDEAVLDALDRAATTAAGCVAAQAAPAGRT